MSGPRQQAEYWAVPKVALGSLNCDRGDSYGKARPALSPPSPLLASGLELQDHPSRSVTTAFLESAHCHGYFCLFVFGPRPMVLRKYS